MGWSYEYTPFGVNDKKAKCDGLFSDGYTVVKSAMVGNVYYAAIKHTKEARQPVTGTVILTSVDGAYFGYKGINEEMGPGVYDCPAGILKLLTPTENAYAREWREKCRENLNRKNNRRAFERKIKALEPGARLQFVCPCGMSNGLKAGTIITLIVKAHNTEKVFYDGVYIWPVKYIPENSEIIAA